MSVTTGSEGGEIGMSSRLLVKMPIKYNLKIDNVSCMACLCKLRTLYSSNVHGQLEDMVRSNQLVGDTIGNLSRFSNGGGLWPSFYPTRRSKEAW